MFKKKQKKILSLIMTLTLMLFNFNGLIGAQVVKADVITVLSEGFDNVSPNGTPVPVDWTFKGITSYYANDFGLKAPSIALKVTGDQVVTSSFSLAAKATLSFWIKGQGGGTPSVCTSKVLVEQSDGVTWSIVKDIQLTAETKGIQTYKLDSNIKQVRFTLNKVVGNVAIDDVKILQDANPVENVSVTTATLDKATLSLGVGKTSPLVATIAPSNATNKNLTWSSNNSAVATVANGVVTGVTEGTATIRVTTGDGAKTSLCVVTVTANAPPKNKVFNIIEITDFHGQLLDSTNTKPVGAALAKVVKDVKVANPNRTLIIGGGDLYQGTPISNVLHGVPVQKVLSKIGMEVTALGNHEFDWGLNVINTETMKDANYSIVCANMYNKGKDTRPYAPYKIITKDGVKIAVIGGILQEAPSIIMPAMTSPYDFKDVATEVNKVAVDLRTNHLADIVLADIHDGGSSLNTIVNKLHGVDAVFGGHTHTSGDVVNKDADGKDVPTVNAASTGKGFINLKITVDQANKIIGFSPKGSNWNVLTTEISSSIDPDCKKIVDDASNTLLPIFNEKIGTNSTALNKDQVEAPYGESQLGNWMADVVKNYPKSPADVGMVNNGGIRLSPIAAGDITVGTIFNIMPFDNTICTTTMTGAQLKLIFEQAVQTNGKGIQISGVKFIYDSSKPSYKPEVPGQRVKSIIRESNGTIVKDTDILKVNAPDFIATGGDTFTGFLAPEIVASLVDSHETVRDALNADVRAKGKMTVVMNNRIDNQMVVENPVVMTILEARTTLKTAVTLTGTVSAVTGNNVFMQDAIAGICVFNKAGTTFTAKKGDKITVTGNLSIYNGLLEVTPTSAAGVVTVSTGNAVTPKEVTLGAINDSLQGQLVKIKNVTFTSIDNVKTSRIKDSTGSINVYAMPVVAGLAVNDTADITAVVSKYNTDLQLAVGSAADVVKTGGISERKREHNGGSNKNKVVPSIINRINSAAIGSNIKFDLTLNSVVSKSIFNTIKGQDKNITFEKNGISWTFNGKDITSVANYDIDLSLKTVSDVLRNKEATKVYQVTGKDQLLIPFSFNYNGNLPGIATVKIYISKDWAGKSATVFKYFEEKNTYETITTGSIDSDGYITIKINYCSDYFVTQNTNLSQTDFDAMVNGTVLIGTKAFTLNYANNPLHALEINSAIVSGGAIYIKDFTGNWIDNRTGLSAMPK
ncbi:5'-nucleotidase C-terminal domain-containing protein [Clostridium tagluense]|uniref:BIG2 domain-containing protein n=1 Tax=Clostridium tagluense TaxID=360422 RepID=A0A401URC2_9CLOT|nr:5'-nucleotidase C-terminal domain-containing protein [Clostridium tagluense]GCD12067.1 hypothetical protein Ctaglu_36900 [Clostridium tagluense]